MSHSPFTEKLKPFSRRLSPLITSPSFKSYIPDFVTYHDLGNINDGTNYNDHHRLDDYSPIAKYLGYTDEFPLIINTNSKGDYHNTPIKSSSSVPKAFSKKYIIRKLHNNMTMFNKHRFPHTSKSVDDLFGENEIPLNGHKIFSSSNDDIINSLHKFNLNDINMNKLGCSHNFLKLDKNNQGKDIPIYHNPQRPDSLELHTSKKYMKINQNNSNKALLPNIFQSNIKLSIPVNENDDNALGDDNTKMFHHTTTCLTSTTDSSSYSTSSKTPSDHENKHSRIHKNIKSTKITLFDISDSTNSSSPSMTTHHISSNVPLKPNKKVKAYVDFSSFYKLVDQVNFSTDHIKIEDINEGESVIYDNDCPNLTSDYEGENDLNKKLSSLKNAMYQSFFSTN